ncbi:MAG: FAD-dependent urate hydroxylase [Alphaproteobacteria bacterium MarineAlpha9_Bin7]|nr:MAG: FAD-dependent urate hydroxylase [Alphaproteobacteria bacterium MarineAlpha9_Bin7]
MKAIISGAGIGGLTAALCLHNIGYDVEVYEVVSDLKPLGVGINLLPHGAAVLYNLGLGKKLDESGVRTQAIEYRTKFGHVITSDPRGVDAGFEFPQYSIHRGMLQFILLDAARVRLGPDAIKTGAGISSFSQNDMGVTAHLARGETNSRFSSVDGDILIGADGFHSVLRKTLHPNEGPTRYEGMMMWRGVNEHQIFGDARTMFIAGNHDVKLVCYPISAKDEAKGTAQINWVAEFREGKPRRAITADWNQRGNLDFVKHFQCFEMKDIDIIRLLKGTKEIFEYPMVDRNPLPWWSKGRVTLLGDAAHPMYPVGANGASQAILDGAALAEALVVGSPEQGLIAYEKERLGKTTDVVLANREWGPEKVLDLADEKIKGPNDRIEDHISRDEIEAVARNYRKVAGFQKKSESGTRL